jgi:hypothetical protein
MTEGRLLYKYRKFDARTLQMLCEHGLHYSNPAKFNDPLDCNLAIYPDLSAYELIKLYEKLLGPGQAEEFNVAIYNARKEAAPYGQNIHLPSDVKDRFKQKIADLIATVIQEELNQRGVLSLSGTWESVLMWSHYADEHRGICIEYDTTEMPHEYLARVNDDGSRAVSASDIMKWKEYGDKEAEQRVFQTHFYSKAPEWRYEQEWRDIGDKEGKCQSYHITAVLFGARCEPAVQAAVVRMLGSETTVVFRKVRFEGLSFALTSDRITAKEIEHTVLFVSEEVNAAREQASGFISLFDDIAIDMKSFYRDEVRRIVENERP